MVNRQLWGASAAAWLVVVAGGFGVMWRYAARPGAGSRAPAEWPSNSRLERPTGVSTLVMFVHPHCACSRASLSDLGRLLARVPGRVQAEVVFEQPSGVARDFTDGELKAQAQRLPGVVLLDDENEVEARRFGAFTSGATLLYDASGQLRFAGGITDVRGHEGDSFGEERIVALLSGHAADRADSPVFGCPLDDSKEATR